MNGLLVVAVEQAVAAPLCSARLADAGARVIKIERPGGETARHYDRAVNGTSAYFAWLNRGKESVVLDYADPADLDLLKRLIARADIFLQNLAPGATERLGIGSAALVERYPALIAVDIVGYGQDTSYRDMRAYDLLVQAETGLCALTGAPEAPAKVGASVADLATGLNAHAAILEALIARGRHERGQRIEVAMFDCLAEWMSVPLAHHEYAGLATPRVGVAHASIYPYANFRCADGEVVIAVQNPAEWQRFCDHMLEMPWLASDPRFHDNPSRSANRDALGVIIADLFERLPLATIRQRLEAAKLAWGKMSTIEDLSGHPALRRMNIDLPQGQYRAVASPVRGQIAVGAVPALGEHTELVREEFA